MAVPFGTFHFLQTCLIVIQSRLLKVFHLLGDKEQCLLLQMRVIYTVLNTVHTLLATYKSVCAGKCNCLGFLLCLQSSAQSISLKTMQNRSCSRCIVISLQNGKRFGLRLVQFLKARPLYTSGMSPVSIGSGSKSSLMCLRERNRLWAASWFICLMLLSESDPTSLDSGEKKRRRKEQENSES